MRDWGFRPYVPVAQRRAQAAKEIVKLHKSGRAVQPVVIEGRKIATSFWGKAWCDNLERYSDFANRLPRGRTYVNNGSVIDLKIGRGKVEALVSGSEIYKLTINIAVATQSRWKAICADCAGSVGSIVELLKGKLSKNVMERVCREVDGLFPAPDEIKLSCSCPDWADMCKHVAAALYGVGARLDADPDMLFTLRGVDRAELISTVGGDLGLTQTAATNARVLADDDVAALFGLEMEAPIAPPAEDRERKKNLLRAGKGATPTDDDRMPGPAAVRPKGLSAAPAIGSGSRASGAASPARNSQPAPPAGNANRSRVKARANGLQVAQAAGAERKSAGAVRPPAMTGMKRADKANKRANSATESAAAVVGPNSRAPAVVGPQPKPSRGSSRANAPSGLPGGKPKRNAARIRKATRADA